MRPAQEALLAAIRSQGRVRGSIIKVDRFLNHQVDPKLMKLIGEDMAAHFAGIGVDKIITVETSGVIIAQAAALALGKPFVFAKKKKPITMGEFYQADSFSFTKQESTRLFVSKEMLRTGDRLLFIDDFLAKGNTLISMREIARQAQASIAGQAVVIDKGDEKDVYSILTLADIHRELGESFG